MNQRYVRARSVHLQRGLRRRVPAADDDDALAEVGVGLAVIMTHVRKILARHVNQVRTVVITDGEHDKAREPDAPHAARRTRARRHRSGA